MSEDANGGPAIKVLDAWAVVAWLKGEAPACDLVEGLWQQARAGTIRLMLNIVNLGEVFYITSKAQGLRSAELVVSELQALPVEVRAAPNYLVLEAAQLKAQHPISYADAFAVATALREKGSLVSGDPELKRFVGSGVVEVEWLGR